MKKVVFKVITILTILVMMVNIVAPTSVIANTKTDSGYRVYTYKNRDKMEQELAESLEFIMTEATIYDEFGNVADINFEKIYEKYGYTEELISVETQVNRESEMMYTSAGNPNKCAMVAIQDTLGVSAINGLLAGGIVGLLQRKAAKEIAKLVVRYAFKNVVPTAVAASLIWSFGRCMWF